MLLDLPNKFKDQILKYFMKPCNLARQKILFRLIIKWNFPK
jgi:hypothetical protein